MTYPFLIGCSLPVQAADRLSSMPDRHARSPGARDFDQGTREFMAKQNALSGNRCQVTEPVYKVIHQYMVCAGRAIGDGLSPFLMGSSRNSALAQVSHSHGAGPPLPTI
jgi:hypothetical protein